MQQPSSRSQGPIFFVGTPRSGTTVIFESILHHEVVAWLPSQWRFLRSPVLTGLYLRSFSNRRWHGVRHKAQLPGDARRSTPMNKWAPASTEAYEFWQARFSADLAHAFLLGERPSPDEVASTRDWIDRFLAWSGRSRFIHKFTGPARIGFLKQVFPEAVFVHLIRDPVSVVNSLLRVAFWLQGGGAERPWWQGLPDSYLAVYRERPAPEVLALVQCKAITDLARQEAAELAEGAYLELHYEDFVAGPEVELERLLHHCGLGTSARIHRALRERSIRDQNAESRRSLGPDELANVEWALSRL